MEEAHEALKKLEAIEKEMSLIVERVEVQGEGHALCERKTRTAASHA